MIIAAPDYAQETVTRRAATRADKKRSLRLCTSVLGDQLNAADARTDGVGAASLPEPLDSREKRHRRAEPAEGTTRENT